MKIFGTYFCSRKELSKMIADLYADLGESQKELFDKWQAFPFDLGQVVYDLTLKNSKGRYTRVAPDLKRSTITEVVVNELNYFSLVERFRRNDVFASYEDAERYLKYICK